MASGKAKMQAKLMELSFIVPSLDGVQRLLIVCDWLKYSNFGGRYIIVDASNKDHQTLFADYKFVDYLHKPSSDTPSALYFATERVETEFMAVLGDDDFPLIDQYEQIVGQLTENDEFSAGHGLATYVDFDFLLRNATKIKIAKLFFFVRTLLSPRYGSGIDLSFDSEFERLSSIHRNYTVTQFFVIRSELGRLIYTKTYASIGDTHTSEYVACFLQAALCRSRFVDGVYLLRGLGRHRPNNNLAHNRHKLSSTSKVEKRLKAIVAGTPVDKTVASTIYKLTLSARYSSENNRSLGRALTNFPKLVWIRMQLMRLAFCITKQSSHRMKFLLWSILR